MVTCFQDNLQHGSEHMLNEHELPSSEWKRVSAALARRKQGVAVSGAEVKPPREKRRVSTFIRSLQLDNMLQQYLCTTLAAYQVLRDDHRNFPDPFTWKHINTCLGQGPDMICLDHPLGHGLQTDNHTGWDVTHGHDSLFPCVLAAV